MRGNDTQQSSMLCLLSPESRVPKNHPLRPLKKLVDQLLSELSPTFDAMYSSVGRSSIPPERLLKSLLLMHFYTVRSERLFCEQLDYNLLFRWFLNMDMVEESFDHSTFSKNRDRLLEHDVARQFFVAVVDTARREGLASNEHFTVDGTLIDACASLKTFRPIDERKQPPPDDPGNPTVNFHGEKRSNKTHKSKTDPDARLAKKAKGREAKLSYAQHALMENRNGLLVELHLTEANGTAEWDAGLAMLDSAEICDATLGGDKGYDVQQFVDGCRERTVTPHVAQQITKHRGSRIDGRTTRHPGYEISQRKRKRVEEVFGWFKTVGGFRRTRFRGLARNQLASYLVGAAYNLLRMANLLPQLA